MDTLRSLVHIHTMTNAKNEFFQMGLDAFRAGKKCVPCLDSALMSHADLKGAKVGDGTVLSALKAWYAGWHHGNVNENPV